MAEQDPAHDVRRDAEFGADPVLPAVMFDPDGDDPGLDLSSGAGRLPVRSRRAVSKAGVAPGDIEASDPTMGALP